jgi:hypothetical protein
MSPARLLRATLMLLGAIVALLVTSPGVALACGITYEQVPGSPVAGCSASAAVTGTVVFGAAAAAVATTFLVNSFLRGAMSATDLGALLEHAQVGIALGNGITIPHDIEPELLPQVQLFRAGQTGAWNRTVNRRRLQPDATFIEETTGYTYQTDNLGRVVAYSGRLRPITGDRNEYQQKVAGRSDRLATDQGGHLLATIFDGPGEAINLVAQAAKLNLSAWKRMEYQWAAALAAGKTVQVEGQIVYPPGSKRPSHFRIISTIDGRGKTFTLPNR